MEGQKVPTKTTKHTETADSANKICQKKPPHRGPLDKNDWNNKNFNPVRSTKTEAGSAAGSH